MWKRLNLRQRIYATLSGLVGITFLGGLVMVWYTYRVEELLVDIIDKNVTPLQVAESLETAIVNQKGFVSYYYLDGDPAWPIVFATPSRPSRCACFPWAAR
ncbi:MAG: hypothetical protein PVG62_10790 [Desulfobacterales bacterium]|jgi:CHASE3 domain sensor protein